MSNVTDSRAIEKLIACLRYEMAHNPLELCGNVFEFVQKRTLDPDGQPDYEDDTIADEVKRAAIARIQRNGEAMAEALIATLAANGDRAVADAFVESLAARRRQCEAKFSMLREIPFADEEERSELAAEWDASNVASMAARASKATH